MISKSLEMMENIIQVEERFNQPNHLNEHLKRLSHKSELAGFDEPFLTLFFDKVSMKFDKSGRCVTRSVRLSKTLCK